ncbi:hypothetical protein QQ045_017519 [Rhodiola kirilowii]
MVECNLEPNESTLVSILSVCAQSGSLEMGNRVRSLVEESGIELSVRVVNALIDMYSKCGDPPTSSPFREMDTRERIVWSGGWGKPSVHFTVAEFEAGEALFRFSLIAKFTVGRPSIAEIREVFKAHWAIKGRATVSDIWDGRHVMIILDSEEDARCDNSTYVPFAEDWPCHV